MRRRLKPSSSEAPSVGRAMTGTVGQSERSRALGSVGGMTDLQPDIHVSELDPVAPVPAGHVLLDVREQDEWDAGHAPGAWHIPLSDLPTRIDELPEADFLVVCRSGGRSSRAAAGLNQSGYDARNLDGGMKGWAAANLPVTAPGGAQPRIL